MIPRLSDHFSIFGLVFYVLKSLGNFFLELERDGKDSRRSGMSQSCFFWAKLGHGKAVGIRFYSAI